MAWKLAIPGSGGSTPVVAGSTAYLTAGAPGEPDPRGKSKEPPAAMNYLLAIDLETGELKWKTPIGIDRGGKHRKGSGSNPSPVTDGEHIYCYFRSGDLACVDIDGHVQWHTNIQVLFGRDSLWWDLGTSPLLTPDSVVIAVMQTGPSFLVAFDKKTGQRKWKADRSVKAPLEAAQSYTTPVAVAVNNKPAIAVMGADHLTLNQRDNGQLIGQLGGFNPGEEEYFRSISSPAAEGHVIVCPYARGETLTGVDMNALADGKGDQSILWFRDDLGSDVPTPAIDQGTVYVVSDGKATRGRVSALDLMTGKTKWDLQLPKSRLGYSSSPLVAGNHLYAVQEDGTTFVVGPLDAGQPELVATNQLADDQQFTVASPVPLPTVTGQGDLLLRTKGFLHRISAR
ncbi:MAG: PQQ-binding-like beta-propeller repeat protein [Planctomycetota bacterium]